MRGTAPTNQLESSIQCLKISRMALKCAKIGGINSMVVVWPIVMFGADITDFALKKEYADKYEDWADLFYQNDNKIFHVEIDHHSKN